MATSTTHKPRRKRPSPELAQVLNNCISTLNDFAASFEADEKVDMEDSFFWSRYNEDSTTVKDGRLEGESACVCEREKERETERERERGQ